MNTMDPIALIERELAAISPNSALGQTTDHIRQAPSAGAAAKTRKEGNEHAQNLSAQKETEKQGPWVQKENGHRKRP